MIEAAAVPAFTNRRLRGINMSLLLFSLAASVSDKKESNEEGDVNACCVKNELCLNDVVEAVKAQLATARHAKHWSKRTDLQLVAFIADNVGCYSNCIDETWRLFYEGYAKTSIH